MKKYARLFTLLLAFSVPFGYTSDASAMSRTCSAVERYLENPQNASSSWYSWYFDYYFTYCNG